MNNRSLRYAKLMKTMGMKQPEQSSNIQSQRIPVIPEKFEALTGTEHPELKDKRKMQILIDNKIAELEQSDDPTALDTLNFWKQKREELNQ